MNSSYMLPPKSKYNWNKPKGQKMSDTNAAVAETPPKKKEPILIRLSRLNMFRDEVGRRMCLLFNPPNNEWRSEHGWVSSRSNADKMSVATVLDTYDARSSRDQLMAELVDQEMAEILSKRKCTIEGLLTKPIVEILRKAPKNPHARAHLLRRSGKTPPAEIADFDSLKKWVEENCEPLPVEDEQPNTSDPLRVPTREDDAGFTAAFEGRYTESGSCHYQRESRGRFNATIHPDLVRTTLAQLPPGANLRTIHTHLVNGPLNEEMQGIEENWENNDSLDDRESDESRLTISPEMSGSFERSLAGMLRRMLSREELIARGINP